MWPAQMLPKLPDGTVNDTRSSRVPFPLRRREEVAAEVVDDLRDDARPVDRVDGADRVARLEGGVAADRLDDVLAVVEDAVDREVVDVRVRQREHLRGLERAHASLRRQHEDAHVRLAAHRVFGRAAGVARCRADDVQHAARPRERVLEQVAEQLHREVLERERRAVRQLQQREARSIRGERRERRDRRVAERLGRVRLRDDRPQVGGRHVGREQPHDLERELGDTTGSATRRACRGRPCG